LGLKLRNKRASSLLRTLEDAEECLSIALMVIKFGEELLRSVSGKD